MCAVLKHFNSVGGAGVVGQYGLKMVLTVSHGLMASKYMYILKHEIIVIQFVLKGQL